MPRDLLAGSLLRAFCAVLLICGISSTCAHGNPAGDALQVGQPLRIASSGAGDSAASAGLTSSEIVIGSCLPMTGRLGWKGQIISRTAQAYFDSINEHGGINGRKIKYVACDDAYNPEKAVICFNTCLKDKVFIGAMFNGSPTIAKYIRMGEITKIPLMGFLVGASVIYDLHPYQFVLRPSYAQECERLIKNLYVDQGVRKFALIFQSDVMGASIRESVIKELGKFHTAPVAEASFSRDLNDPQTGLDLVEKSKPEVIILGVNSGGIAPTIAWRTASKCRSLCATFSPMDDALLHQGKASDGVLITQIMPPPESNLPGIERYRQLVSQRLPGEKPNFLGLEVFMNAEVVAQALKLAGPNLTRAKFAQAMESLHNYDLGAGARYKVTFNARSHVGFSPEAIYFSQVRSGKLVPASDEDIKRLVDQARAANK